MKEENEFLIGQLQERIDNSPFLVVVDYTGLDVPGFSELRNRLSELGAECHVTKNTALKRAAAKVGLPEDFNEHLGGQVAAVTGDGDICATAKVLKNFEKEFERPKVRGGVLDGNVVDATQLAGLADLPSARSPACPASRCPPGPGVQAGPHPGGTRRRPRPGGQRQGPARRLAGNPNTITSGISRTRNQISQRPVRRSRTPPGWILAGPTAVGLKPRGAPHDSETNKEQWQTSTKL